MSEQRLKAERYAEAILEAIVEQWQQALTAVNEALAADPKLRASLENGKTALDTRLKSLATIVPKGTAAEVENFLKMLVQEGDLSQIPGIMSALQSGLTGHSGPVEAEIASVTELSDGQKEDLRQQLSAHHGGDLVFSFQVDPTLLGGLRVRIGDKLTDHTVASRLTALREMIASTVR